MVSIFFGVKNSKNCKQFVIDSNELLSGINIPKQNDCQCFYIESEDTRVGVYEIVNTASFIRNHRFEKLIGENRELLWSQKFLNPEELTFPDTKNSLFLAQGIEKGNKWQSLLDVDSGIMWFEVKWIQ
jgi:hypothetical protein